MPKKNAFIAFIILIICNACQPEPLEPLALPEIENQFGQLPEIPAAPRNNPYTTEKAKLGKILFWDPILSGNKDVACVTCHHPKNGYAEQLDLSIGVGGVGISESRKGGVLIKRNAPTILNTAFNGIQADGTYSSESAPMFWDNRTQSLELQAIQPILSAEEMRGSQIKEKAILDTVLLRLKNIPEYVTLFEAAFGESGITEENLGKAIATFERTLISNKSRFDQYIGGDATALSNLEIQGMAQFVEAGCADCHSGPMFSDYELHVLTVPENGKLSIIDKGDGDFAFRTPTLRNLGSTAPYMHNGMLATLEEVLEFYDDAPGESQNPNIASSRRATELIDLDLDDNAVESIIAFLNTLNDDGFDKEIVNEVPSGLQVGGRID